MYEMRSQQQSPVLQQHHPESSANHEQFPTAMPSIMDNIRDQERVDGVRFVWNTWPCNKETANRMVIPLGVFLTPMKPRPDMPSFNYEPVYCNKCRAILNPFR